MSAYPSRDFVAEPGDSLHIDRARTAAKCVLPPGEPPRESREQFVALRIIVVVEIEIPIAPNANRHEVETDVVDAVATAVVPRVPYLKTIEMAHSRECVTDFTGGIQTIAVHRDTAHADRAETPPPPTAA